MSIAEYQTQAEQALRSTGERVTRGRMMVLASLLEAKRALTHREVEQRIEPLHEIDRVTVYRVLDWLTQQGLTRRLAGEDRVWRFVTVRDSHTHGRHAHFECKNCGDVIHLDEIDAAPRVSLPAGYRGEELVVTVKGLCAVCASRAPVGGRRKVRSPARAPHR